MRCLQGPATTLVETQHVDVQYKACVQCMTDTGLATLEHNLGELVARTPLLLAEVRRGGRKDTCGASFDQGSEEVRARQRANRAQGTSKERPTFYMSSQFWRATQDCAPPLKQAHSGQIVMCRGLYVLGGTRKLPRRVNIVSENCGEPVP